RIVGKLPGAGSDNPRSVYLTGGRKEGETARRRGQCPGKRGPPARPSRDPWALFTPKGLDSLAQGQRNATPGRRSAPQAPTPKGLHMKGRCVRGTSSPVCNPFGVGVSQQLAPQGGAALTLGYGIQPLRGTEHRGSD